MSEPSLDEISTMIRTELIENGDPADDRFTAALSNLERIERLRREGHAPTLTERLDPNTVVSAGASIAGILAVINAERIMVISTKAFGLLSKIRL